MEKSVWAHLKKKFDFGLIERHEDLVNAGVADTSYNFVDMYHSITKKYSGWIELKEAKMPKRVGSRVRIKFEPLQKPWLKRRGIYGADAWVLVRVDREYLLFYWTEVDMLDMWSIGEMRENAEAFWKGGIASNELKNVLMKFG